MADASALSFEQALKELEGIASEVEQGDVALDKLVSIYSRAGVLHKHCSAQLTDARSKIEKVEVNPESSDIEFRNLD